MGREGPPTSSHSQSDGSWCRSPTKTVTEYVPPLTPYSRNERPTFNIPSLNNGFDSSIFRSRQKISGRGCCNGGEKRLPRIHTTVHAGTTVGGHVRIRCWRRIWLGWIPCNNSLVRGYHVPGTNTPRENVETPSTFQTSFLVTMLGDLGSLSCLALVTEPSPHSADGSFAAAISPGRFSAEGLWKAPLDGPLTRAPREQ